MIINKEDSQWQSSCEQLLSRNSHIKYSEFRRWLKKQGCTGETHEGGSGHITVLYRGRRSQLPAHGAGKDLKKGLVEAIKKQLGLK